MGPWVYRAMQQSDECESSTPHLPIGVLGETNGPRLGDTLQSSGDVDAVAHQVAVALLDHIAEMDADAELDASLGRKASIALDHAVLHLDGTMYGVNNAAELNEDAVTSSLDEASVMYSDGGIDQIAAERAQPRKRPPLVGAGKLAGIRRHPPPESPLAFVFPPRPASLAAERVA
jgi:hypothetical protein